MCPRSTPSKISKCMCFRRRCVSFRTQQLASRAGTAELLPNSRSGRPQGLLHVSGISVADRATLVPDAGADIVDRLSAPAYSAPGSTSRIMYRRRHEASIASAGSLAGSFQDIPQTPGRSNNDSHDHPVRRDEREPASRARHFLRGSALRNRRHVVIPIRATGRTMMRNATGRPYESFLFALQKLSRAEQDRTGEEY